MYRRNGRGRVLLLVFLALSILLITLDFRSRTGGPLRAARDFSEAIVTPIQRGFTAVVRPVGNFFSSLGDIANLREENTRLQEELERLQAQVAEAIALENENQELRAALGLDESWVTLERVTAAVIGKSPSNYKWTVTIDKGRNDGVRPDMAVITPEGLVGKVIAVQTDTATVLLLIDRSGAAGARLEDSGEVGLVEGNGAGQPLSLRFIPADVEVAVGDEIVTSGQAPRGSDPIFPPGIPIGVVSGVGGDARALEKEIEVMPAVNFNTLRFVQVLLGTGRKLSSASGAG
jgi:rod shape-determining protein MreC